MTTLQAIKEWALMEKQSNLLRTPILFYAVVDFFFQHLTSEVAWPIINKLYHMFDVEPDLRNSVRNLAVPSTRNLATQKRNFSTISDSFMTISRISSKHNKTSSIGKWRCKNTDTPAEKTFGSRTAKIGPEF